MSEPKMLALDAAAVPVVYRIKVTSNGNVVGGAAHTMLPGEVDRAVDMVRAEFEAAGYGDVTVEVHPA